MTKSQISIGRDGLISRKTFIKYAEDLRLREEFNQITGMAVQVHHRRRIVTIAQAHVAAVYIDSTLMGEELAFRIWMDAYMTAYERVGLNEQMEKSLRYSDPESKRKN
ncbi:hypothetical protein TWF696_008900 [Orbilia brochopaga]|uniref:Uncharacterized protein n=1 Tax=Orbilia brochopaga TaxID=3140254 RepID=A0AAV9UDN3_9PEZI